MLIVMNVVKTKMLTEKEHSSIHLLTETQRTINLFKHKVILDMKRFLCLLNGSKDQFTP